MEILESTLTNIEIYTFTYLYVYKIIILKLYKLTNEIFYFISDFQVFLHLLPWKIPLKTNSMCL